VPGEVAPSVRELARQYELSVGVVGQQLQVLLQEGLFHTVSGAGTFVGRPQSNNGRFFLFVLPGSQLKPPPADRYHQIQVGFEEEITRRGGASLAMTHDQVVAQLSHEAMPLLDGFFIYRPKPKSGLTEQLNAKANANPDRLLPEVDWGGFSELNPQADCVNFDNFNGGLQATQHLLSGGHRRIAFLGVHAPSDARDIEWSVERQRGWQAALERAKLPTDGLAFLPRKLVARWIPDSDKLINDAAQRLINEATSTAVVAANDPVALQLIEACRISGLPSEQWPAIVSFDDLGRWWLHSDFGATALGETRTGCGGAALGAGARANHRRAGRSLHRFAGHSSPLLPYKLVAVRVSHGFSCNEWTQ
jgi:hypothetical protein